MWDIDIHHEMIDQRPSCPTIPNSQVDLKWINSGSCGNCGNYTYLRNPKYAKFMPFQRR